MFKIKACTGVLVSALMAAACFAQGDKGKDVPQKFYRLGFLLQEIHDGRAVNARAYSIVVGTGQVGEVRTGNKVPFKAGDKPDYIDVGVNIDARHPREVEGQLVADITAEVSSLAPGETAGAGLPPFLRQNRWQSEVIVRPGKPVVIFSSDDLTSTNKMQLEVTATPIK